MNLRKLSIITKLKYSLGRLNIFPGRRTESTRADYSIATEGVRLSGQAFNWTLEPFFNLTYTRVHLFRHGGNRLLKITCDLLVELQSDDIRKKDRESGHPKVHEKTFQQGKAALFDQIIARRQPSLFNRAWDFNSQANERAYGHYS